MSVPTAHVEIIAAQVRVYKDGARYGDPYDWCCTARTIDRDTFMVSGVDKAPSISQLRAMKDAMKEIGFRRAVWERIKGGNTTKHKYEIHAES